MGGNIKVSGSGVGIIFPDNTTQTTAADVTAVFAGTGLTGGGGAGDLTLNLDTSFTENAYVNVGGDTMTGKLQVTVSNPTSNLIEIIGTGTVPGTNNLLKVNGDPEFKSLIGAFASGTKGAAIEGSGPTGVKGLGSGSASDPSYGVFGQSGHAGHQEIAGVFGHKSNTDGAAGLFLSSHSGADILRGYAGSSITGGTLRFVLTNSGSVGIGTAGPLDRLHVSGGEIRTDSCVKNMGGATIAGSCSSDARLKKNVHPVEPLLAEFAHLQPVRFEWRADEFPAYHFGSGTNTGLIAQDVEKLFPSLVSADDRGFKRVNYTELQMLTVQAVKELRAETARADRELRAENERLRRELAELRALVAQIAANVHKE